ncbi:neutral alpha-glucosidase C-like [Diabrotica virgifera virgifera]|uniref:Glucosidase II subunit alpha n=1 Tax=Diabrotica virgifera virgifera TaxID=50390 RepID=A0A6P7FE02_DIAVI|nr:neutral alpha-glucosidase C-like [Diabrotica virgifera virgifera]XP_050515525.1 neutral alpha-glucosidase C-like [Diabrotica virgifera virgifera]
MAEMIRYAILLVVLATTAAAIDKTVFKSCSERPFCNRLRNYVVDDKSKYSADVYSASIKDNILTVPLKNENGNSLNLLVSMFEGNKIRVKVEDPDSKRFELGDIVIIEELKELPLVSDTLDGTDGSLLVTPKDESLPYKVVIDAGPPLNITFYYGGLKQVVLDGERLVYESTDESKAFTFKADFPEANRLYGLLDHAWSLALGDTNNGTAESGDPLRLRNSDSWGYEANSPMALYGARPVVYGHSANKTSGIFLHNAAEQWIDASSGSEGKDPSVYFIVERAAFDLFILLGPTPKEIVRQFTGLTGKAHLPQIWALGYHQCRFSYKSQDDVKDVVARLDENDFPWDAIWLDGDHTDDYKWFHWNHTTYTDPVELQQNISATGRVCVSISDPHIKVDDDYDVYAGAKGKYFTKWANGSEYVADCWPGASSWIDYLNPEAADYYSTWFSFEKFNGSTPTLAGIWNDMNEPAVFDDSTEKTMPWEVQHYGGVEHGDIHNIYGLLHVKSTHKGLMARDQNAKRPFVLTRSNFAGSQRYAAMWTGDNSATWEHFANSISECMNANMLGMVFCGADIGGFIGDPSDELLQRWYQGAVWTPFFRGHSSRESKRREPYLFSKDVQDVIRNALRLRYQHIPAIYTLFYEHTVTGDPIISPLYYQYPRVNDRDTQTMIGADIMSVAVTKPGVKSVEVYFPGGYSDTDPFDKQTDFWYRADQKQFSQYRAGLVEQIEVDITSSPVFYRAGSIVFVLETPRKSAVEAKDDFYSIYVNVDRRNSAKGRLYKDDLYSFNYQKDNYFYSEAKWIPGSEKMYMTTISGTPDQSIRVFYVKVVVHELLESETGELQIKKSMFTKTSGGIPLHKIDIAKALREGNGTLELSF